MTTEQRIKASRQNAKRSTGPQTTQGRAHASRNALRHGLAVSIANDPELSAEAKRLSGMIVGTEDDARRRYYAGIAAEAEIEILRIRRVRTQLLDSQARRSGNFNDSTIETVLDASPQLFAMDRYEQRALSRRKHAIRQLSSA